jgi:hypothetical protein
VLRLQQVVALLVETLAQLLDELAGREARRGHQEPERGEVAHVVLDRVLDAGVLDLDRHRAAADRGPVDLADARGGERLGLEAVEHLLERSSVGGLDHAAHRLRLEAGRARLQPLERRLDPRRQLALGERRHLADLHRQALQLVEPLDQRVHVVQLERRHVARPVDRRPPRHLGRRQPRARGEQGARGPGPRDLAFRHRPTYRTGGRSRADGAVLEVDVNLVS